MLITADSNASESADRDGWIRWKFLPPVSASILKRVEYCTIFEILYSFKMMMLYKCESESIPPTIRGKMRYLSRLSAMFFITVRNVLQA